MQIDEEMIKTRLLKLNVDIKDNENDDINEFNNNDVKEVLMITLSTIEKSNKNNMKN